MEGSNKKDSKRNKKLADAKRTFADSDTLNFDKLGNSLLRMSKEGKSKNRIRKSQQTFKLETSTGEPQHCTKYKDNNNIF